MQLPAAIAYSLAANLLAALALGTVACSTQDARKRPGAKSVIPEAAPPPGLKDHADFPIGGAISIRKLAADTQLRDIVLRDFNSVTATNDFKAYRIAREPGRLDFSRADSTARFAEANHLRLFGHTLLWHNLAPAWQRELSPAAARAFLEMYIDTVVRHFAGRVDGWDVVNEVVSDDDGARRESFWREKLGEDYVTEAFRLARAADPDAELFINDYDTERDTAKLSTLLEIVEEVRAAGDLIDGIGYQMHIAVGADTAAIGAALRRGAATGLLIHVSELDAVFNGPEEVDGRRVVHVEAVTPELLERQADTYEALARVYRDNVPPDQRYGITFWDFTDRDTWIRSYFDVADWPTVYDDTLAPKPAWEGFARGLRQE